MSHIRISKLLTPIMNERSHLMTKHSLCKWVMQRFNLIRSYLLNRVKDRRSWLQMLLLVTAMTALSAQTSFAQDFVGSAPIKCSTFSSQWVINGNTYGSLASQTPLVLNSATFADASPAAPKLLYTILYRLTRNNCYRDLTAYTAADYYAGFILPSDTAIQITDNPNIAIKLKQLPVISLSGNSNCTKTGWAPDANHLLYTATVHIPSSVSSSTNGCTFSFDFSVEVYALSNNLTTTTNSPYPLPSTGPLFNGISINGLGTFGGRIAYWWPVVNNAGGLGLTTNAARFIAPACTLATNNMTVYLDYAQTGDLTVTGQTAGAKNFTIPLNNVCSGGGYADTNKPSWNVKANWSFSGPTNDTIANTTTNRYAATNVALQILDTTGTPVQNASKTLLTTVTASGSSPNWSYSVANRSPQYSVRYYALGQAGAGAVAGVATFTLYYD